MKLKIKKKRIRIIIIISLLILFLIYIFSNYYYRIAHIPFIPIIWIEKQEDWSSKFVKYKRYYDPLLLIPYAIWREDKNGKEVWKFMFFGWWRISAEWYYKNWEKEWKWVEYWSNWRISAEWYYKNWEKEWKWIEYWSNWEIKNENNYKNWEYDWKQIEFWNNWKIIWEKYYNNWTADWIRTNNYENWDPLFVIKYDNWKTIERIHYYEWGQIESIIKPENLLNSVYYNEDWTEKKTIKTVFDENNEYTTIVDWKRIQNRVDYSRNKTIVTYKWIWWEEINDNDFQYWIDHLFRFEGWWGRKWYWHGLDLSEVKNFTEEQLNKISSIKENPRIIYNENYKFVYNSDLEE